MNQICSSVEILSVGNITRDSNQILERHDLAANDPSPSQSEIVLVLHEITKTRECVNAVFDRLDDFSDSLDTFCEKRERYHRVNRVVAISKSTSPAYSFMESIESDYRPQRVNGQRGWQKTLCFRYKAPGHFVCECPNLSAPSRDDMDLCSPAGTRRNNNVFITFKRRRRRCFDVMKTLSLRHYCVMCPLGGGIPWKPEIDMIL